MGRSCGAVWPGADRLSYPLAKGAGAGKRRCINARSAAPHLFHSGAARFTLFQLIMGNLVSFQHFLQPHPPLGVRSHRFTA
jgi:hypothetical protein